MKVLAGVFPVDICTTTTTRHWYHHFCKRIFWRVLRNVLSASFNSAVRNTKTSSWLANAKVYTLLKVVVGERGTAYEICVDRLS